MDTRCTSVPISWTPDATLPCPISWTINASLPHVKHAPPHCITLRPKCITPRKNATPAMQNASPSPCSVAFVSKRSRSHTPETPIDTMCQFGVSFFYALKGLRRKGFNLLTLHIHPCGGKNQRHTIQEFPNGIIEKYAAGFQGFS